MKINSKDLKYRILNGEIENLYLFSGPEIGDKKEIIDLIINKIFLDQEIYKFTFYCGYDFNLLDFINTLKTGLLFSNKKIIILKNIENINTETIRSIEDYIIPKLYNAEEFQKNILKKINNENKKKSLLNCYNKEHNQYEIKNNLKSADKKNIIEILYSINYKNYDKDTYLIMLNETNEKIPSELTNLLVPQQNITFWEMFESQKSEWLREEFKKNDFYISEDALSFMLDMIENNKASLSNEVNKILLLFHPQKMLKINLSNPE